MVLQLNVKVCLKFSTIVNKMLFGILSYQMSIYESRSKFDVKSAYGDKARIKSAIIKKHMFYGGCLFNYR